MQEWLNCIRCGHRYKTFLSACPRCGHSKHTYPKYSANSKTSKSKLIGIGIGLVAVMIGAIIFFGPGALIVETQQPSQSDGTESVVNVDSEIEPENSPSPPVPALPTFIAKVPVEELREQALNRINDDRARFDMPPVQLSDNQAAQAHAQDLFEHLSDSTHWTSDGMKPYMKYTIHGGTGYVAQNVHSGAVYEDIERCRIGLDICMPINISETLEESQDSMMYDDAHANWGHRYNILNKYHTHVSLGIVYDDYYFAYVQNFENNYLSGSEPIEYHDGVVRLHGELPAGYNITSILIFYDEQPTPDVYQRNKDLPYYSFGKLIAGVSPGGSYFFEITTINADNWSESGNIVDVSFDISSIDDEAGVYTILANLKNDAVEGIPATSYSIFVE